MNSIRNAGTLTALVLLVAGTASLQAQQWTPQQRLMARRAAEVDGYRKIAETVKGLRISSKTQVRDFVTQSDQINTAFSHFIRGIRIVGAPVYHQDGTCEVTVAVTLRQVIRELQRIRRRHYVGAAWHDHTFEKIRIHTRDKVITATGYGAPGGAKVEQPEKIKPHLPDAVVPPKPRWYRPKWVYKASPILGKVGWEGYTGQGRLLALRAAMADGYRKLAETIKGVRIDSRTTVRDFVTASDQINTAVATFLRGARILGEPEYKEDGTCEVTMAVTISQLIQELRRIRKRHYVGDRFHDHTFVKISKYQKEKIVRAVGYGAPRPDTRLPGTRFVGWNQLGNPRMRLMALLTARRVGQRNLAETIKGLHLTSTTRVQDFVASADSIVAELHTEMRAIREVGDICFFDDGSVQVDVEVTWQQVIRVIKKAIRRHYVGNAWHDHPIHTVNIYQTQKYIRARGQGALPSSPRFYRPGGDPPDPKPLWYNTKVTVTGQGVPPEHVERMNQALLLAQRAAEADAYRKMAERIRGVRINARTTVSDFVTRNDSIKTAVDALIKGAKTVTIRKTRDGTVEVDMMLSLRGLWEVAKKFGAAKAGPARPARGSDDDDDDDDEKKPKRPAPKPKKDKDDDDDDDDKDEDKSKRQPPKKEKDDDEKDDE